MGNVLVLLLSTLSVPLELVDAAEGSYKLRTAKMSFLLPNSVTLLSALLACGVHAVTALGIRTSKGRPPSQFDLPIKQVNGFRSGQPQLGKNVLHLAFEARFDSDANHRGPTRKPNGGQ